MGTMCVSQPAFPGARCLCYVCAWSKAGEALIKATGLVQGCQSDGPGDIQLDGVQMRATTSDSLQINAGFLINITPKRRLHHALMRTTQVTDHFFLLVIKCKYLMCS